MERSHSPYYQIQAESVRKLAERHDMPMVARMNTKGPFYGSTNHVEGNAFHLLCVLEGALELSDIEKGCLDNLDDADAATVCLAARDKYGLVHHGASPPYRAVNSYYTRTDSSKSESARIAQCYELYEEDSYPHDEATIPTHDTRPSAYKTPEERRDERLEWAREQIDQFPNRFGGPVVLEWDDEDAICDVRYGRRYIEAREHDDDYIYAVPPRRALLGLAKRTRMVDDDAELFDPDDYETLRELWKQASPQQFPESAMEEVEDQEVQSNSGLADFY